MDGEQGRLAQGGQAVPERRGGLVPPATVGEVAADEADQCADPVVDAVEQTEAQRGQTQLGHQVQRQNGGDHLRGDIGDETDRAQHEHRVRHRPQHGASGRPGHGAGVGGGQRAEGPTRVWTRVGRLGRGAGVRYVHGLLVPDTGDVRCGRGVTRMGGEAAEVLQRA